MKLFIPEGFIYFYLYSGGPDLFSQFYGTVDRILVDSACFYHGSNIFDGFIFNNNKILWGPAWKGTYFRFEAPFFKHLAINDRFNWGYNHTIYKLVTEWHNALFVSKFASIKGYGLSINRQIFLLTTFSPKHVILDIGDSIFYPVFQSIAMLEGLSRNNGWNHTPYAIFLFEFDISYLISRIFNRIFTYIFYYIYLLIASIALLHIYTLILFFLFFFVLFSYFRYFLYLEKNSFFDFANILNIIDEMNKFVYHHMQQLTNSEGKTSSLFVLYILNLVFYKHYKLIDGYSKFFVFLLAFKQKYFRLNNFLFFVLAYSLKRVYENFYSILNHIFIFFASILWSVTNFYFPLIFFFSKYTAKYAGIFKHQLNIWFFAYLNFIVSDLRDGSVGSSVLGWIRWTQISAAWDEFVDNEWLKIDKFREEYIRKKEQKMKFDIEEEMQKADDEVRRKKLKRKGVDDEQIEKTVKYHQDKRRQANKNKEQWIFHEMIQTKKYKKRYEFFKKKLIDKHKPKSRLWLKLYNIFTFDYTKKVYAQYDEKLFKMDKEISYEFIKEMAYYNWLMERKYLLLKEDYSYYDYMDFMNIQQSMLVYYAETAQMLNAFSSFFKMIGFFFKTDDSYINYTKFDSGLAISSIIKINLGISRFYFKFFTYENSYFKNFVESLLIFFQLLTFSSYIFVYMFVYILSFIYYFYLFFRLILSSDRILIYHYYFILLFKLKKKSANFIILLDKLNQMLIYIKFILKFFIKFIMLIRYVKAVYQFFVDAFIDTYYWIKYGFSDICYYFYSKGYILLDRFKFIIMFFIFIYFSVGLTPYDLYSMIFGLILKIFFNYGYYYAVESTILVSLKESLFVFFFSWDMYKKFDFFYLWFSHMHLSYLNGMYKFYIYSYFTPIFDIMGRLLTFPFYLFLSYTPYLSSISHWTWYDLKTLEVLNYLKQHEVMRELVWRNHHFYKTIFGGYLIHPIYRFYKNNHSEWLIVSKYLWYSVFSLDYKIRVTYFFARLISYIVVFPYWALRYGPYYVGWQYYSYGVNSSFLNISLFIVYFEMYVRWHLLGFIVTLFGVFLIYPSSIFWLYYEIIGFIIIKLNMYYIPFLFNNFFVCLMNYYDIYNNSWYSINVELLSFFSVSCLFYVEILLNYLFYLNAFSLGTIKIIGHFFQCFIPFIRYFIKYDVMFFLLWIDIFTSIMSLLLIIYNLFSIPFHFIFSVFHHLYLFFHLSSVGIMLGDFAEFFYKSILYPYFVVNFEGFFDYYGKYSLFSSGYGTVTINQSVYFTDVKDVFYSKRAYMSAQRRWALVSVDGYSNLYYGFTFRLLSYREIGAATLFFQIYVWFCYILYVFVICLIFSGVSNYLRHKDNIFPDSAYLWYRLTPNNKLINFSREEFFWLTQNKWTFDNIKGIFVNDNLKYYKEEEDIDLLGELALNCIRRSAKHGFAVVGNENDYMTHLNYLLSYSSFKNQDKFDKYLKDIWKAIRYKRIQKRIEALFTARVFSKPFASVYFKSFKFELLKNSDVEDLEVVSASNNFWDFWLKFAVPILIFNKYGYGTFTKYDKNFDFRNFFKALTLMVMKKDDKFKDLHDFYFLEHDFYENFNDIWLWSKQRKGHLLRSIVGSRHTSRMAYSSRSKLNNKLLDPLYVNNLYDYFSKIIRMSSYDSSIFNNLLNLRMHNLLTSDRIVETQLTAKQIEQRVLEDYTDFMETGWEQDRMEDGQLAVYKYLSERLYESFLDNEQDSENDEEKIYINTMYNTSNKLSLKSHYTPFPDPWLAFSIILPLLISIHFYKVFILFSYAASHFRPSYMYEICFFFVYLFYYVNTHLFFVTICSSLMFYPKLLNKRRRLRTFSTAKILSVIEKFFPNNELFRMLVNFSAVTPIFFFIKPAMDFFFFYVIFIVLIIALFKIIVDVDTH